MTTIRITSIFCAVIAAGSLASCSLRQSGVESTETVTAQATATTEIATESSVSDISVASSVTTEIADTAVPPETTSVPPSDNPEGNSGSAIVDGGKTATGMSVQVIDGVTYVNGILVANKTYALPESYYTGGLTDETYAAFVSMQSAAKSDGLTLFCKSGFRSFIDQRIIYDGYVARDGQDLADTYSARPGHSEHQSGMALDINSTSSDFADTPEGKWLAENCWDYGFIIRYPADKVDITGYMYEPWHVRYVGREIAFELKDSGLCLEEYLGITSEYQG